jgi:hypothetical protein
VVLVVARTVVVAIAPLPVIAGPTLARTVPAALVGTTLTRTILAWTIPTAVIRPTLIWPALTLAWTALIGTTLVPTALTGAAAAAALVLVAAIPAAIATTIAAAAVVVAPAATARLRALGLRRRRGLLDLNGLLTAPVGTLTAIATVAARLTPTAIAAALTTITAALRPFLSLGLLLRLLLLLAAVAAATASAIQTILARAGGLGRGPAQQRQDHGGRDQTLHFKCSKGPGAGPIAHPLYLVSALFHEPYLNEPPTAAH